MEKKKCRHCKEKIGDFIDCKTKTKAGPINFYWSCRECNTERQRKYRNCNRKKVYSYVYKSIEKHKEKHKARGKVAYEIRMGRLIKSHICEKCGKEGKTEGHHKDYKKPLEVNWLCRVCHSKEDILLTSKT